MRPTGPSEPALLLGPLLRHVDPVSATVWVETDRPCEVDVLGRSAHLSSAGVLLALLAGITLGGLPGMILAVPVVTLLKRWLEKYWLPSAPHEAPPRTGSAS